MKLKIPIYTSTSWPALTKPMAELGTLALMPADASGFDVI
jgi:hypothetical protein